jgi:hypothetical protein
VENKIIFLFFLNACFFLPDDSSTNNDFSMIISDLKFIEAKAERLI